MQVKFINAIFTHFGLFDAGETYELTDEQFDHLATLNPRDIELVIVDED